MCSLPPTRPNLTGLEVTPRVQPLSSQTCPDTEQLLVRNGRRIVAGRYLHDVAAVGAHVLTNINQVGGVH